MKKQLLILASLLFLALNLAASEPDGVEPAEDGGIYQIETWQNLLWISQNTSSWNAEFIQTANIDFADADPAIADWNDGEGWSPIGGFGDEFTGNYDGGGNTISNLHIDRADESRVGLFGIMFNASISNLGVIDASITGGNRTGGIVGGAEDIEIYNCFFSGTITGGQHIGGIVGESFNLEIHNSYNLGVLNGTNFIGGLVGLPLESIEITRSYSAGSINLSKEGQKSKNSSMGGLIGTIDPHGSVSITDSYFDKDMVGLDVPIDEGEDGITGKTTAEMKNINTFSDWNIDGNLDIPIDYPFLAWEDDNSKGLVWKIGTGEPAGDEPDDDEDGIYLIETWQHLLWISQNSDTWGDNFKQIDNIDFADVIEDGYPEIQYWNDGKGWLPIGTASVYKNDKRGHKPFTGSYDGGSFEIQNLFIDPIGLLDGIPPPDNDEKKNGEEDEFFVGLFGVVEGDAIISNIRLVNAIITGHAIVGGIAGYVTADIEGKAGSPEISNCSVSFSDGRPSVIIGFSESGIFQGAVGGIVGYMDGGEIIGSYNEVTIVGFELKGVGGLAGVLRSGSIANSYHVGEILPLSNYVGGLVGFGGDPEVKFQGEPLKGNGSVQITNSYSAGTFETALKGPAKDFSRINTSGFENLGNKLRDQFLNRPMQPKGGIDQNLGGVIGFLEEGYGTIINTFWDVDKDGIEGTESGDVNFGAEGKTTAEMMDPETYAAWGITEDEDVAKGYPFLVWQDSGSKDPVWFIGTRTTAVPLSNTALYLSLTLIAGFVFFRIYRIS